MLCITTNCPFQLKTSIIEEYTSEINTILMAIENPEKYSILFVDNSKTAREQIGRALTRCKYSVTVADSAEDALTMVKTGNFHMVISDLYMPLNSGIKLIENIIQLKDVKQRTIPVIIYTASLTEADKAKCLSFGAAGFVSKKDSIDALLETTENILKRIEL